MTNTQFNMANSGMEMGDGENMGGGMMGHMTHMGPMAHMGPNPMMMGPMNMGQVIVIITCCVLLICHILCSVSDLIVLYFFPIFLEIIFT